MERWAREGEGGVQTHQIFFFKKMSIRHEKFSNYSDLTKKSKFVMY